MADPTTNTLKGPEDATITVRVIKSLFYRNVKPLVLHHVNLKQTTIADLRAIVKQEISTKPAWKAYRTAQIDTVKLYTVAHGHKTTNLIINLEEDSELYPASEDQTLAEWGIENETEISMFKKAEYNEFVLNPTETKW